MMIVITEYGFDTEVIDWFVKNYRGKYTLKAYGCVPIEYENHIVIPENYRRMDKLGAASVIIGYWMYDNRHEDKIIHLDCDVFIKDYKFLDMLFKDLNIHNIVSAVKGRKKVVNCVYGMTPKIWKNEKQRRLIVKLFGSWGLDCSMEYFNALAMKYSYKSCDLSHDCEYFKHYAKVSRGIYNFKRWVETGDVEIDIGAWYETASIKRALMWSKETKNEILYKDISLDDRVAEEIILYMRNKPFNLREHIEDIKKKL